MAIRPPTTVTPTEFDAHEEDSPNPYKQVMNSILFLCMTLITPTCHGHLQKYSLPFWKKFPSKIIRRPDVRNFRTTICSCGRGSCSPNFRPECRKAYSVTQQEICTGTRQGATNGPTSLIEHYRTSVHFTIVWKVAL